MQPQQWPLYLRSATVAAAAGVTGWLTWHFGAFFVQLDTNPELNDAMPAIGSALMSVSSLIFMLAAVLAVADSIRNGALTLAHAIVMGIAFFSTVAAGVDGAYPR